MTGPLIAADSTASGLHDLDQVLVLAGRPLRPGVVLEDTARFGDEVWALSPAQHQRHRRSVVLNFALFPPGYRLNRAARQPSIFGSYDHNGLGAGTVLSSRANASATGGRSTATALLPAPCRPA
jgi:hypothetical protein